MVCRKCVLDCIGEEAHSLKNENFKAFLTKGRNVVGYKKKITPTGPLPEDCVDKLLSATV